MRPIKFKFWNNKLKKMSKVHGLGIIYEHLSEEWDGFDWEDVEKLQFTGLLDRSGKEIYEGDVVKGNLIKYSPLPIMGEVVWDNELSGFASKNNAGNTLLFEIDQIRIIGDKFQNPELLIQRGIG